ncbi:hypothetical protein PILCRDRAFT_815302 [Piloderma croceum F 1598]|uniref:Uncharacterized protein n=1 Tax=Piloderma croceum (strain F 1598) TaxID=765440 RepID=A0A0C3G4V7_PILCF|nr:hypothetical protein PILCRDRAFT_815302 [Piloderma croceum F 1598]
MSPTSFISHTDPSIPINNPGQFGFRSRLTVSLAFICSASTEHQCIPLHGRTSNARIYSSRLVPLMLSFFWLFYFLADYTKYYKTPKN